MITLYIVTKSVSHIGDIDACECDNYAGLVSFFSSGFFMGSVVNDLNRNQLTYGRIALTA